MIKLFKHTAFKYLLLVILSLKVGYFVAENMQLIHQSEVASLLSSDDFENEREGEKELDESEKIHQLTTPSDFHPLEKGSKKHFSISPKFRDLYFEFTTPPPKVV